MNHHWNSTLLKRRFHLLTTLENGMYYTLPNFPTSKFVSPIINVPKFLWLPESTRDTYNIIMQFIYSSGLLQRNPMELSWRSLFLMYSNLLSKFWHSQLIKIQQLLAVTFKPSCTSLIWYYVVIQSFNICLASQQRPFSAD